MGNIGVDWGGGGLVLILNRTVKTHGVSVCI